MPKVYTTVARKDGPKACPQAKAGQAYYWWRTRMKGARSGVTRCKLTPPKPSDLTMSDFWQQVYGLQEDIAATSIDDADDFVAARDDWVQQMRDIGQEQQDKLDGMPDGLQQGPTGELLQERADACEAWADAVEGIEVEDVDREDYGDDQDGQDEYEDARREAVQDAMNAIGDLIVECG